MKNWGMALAGIGLFIALIAMLLLPSTVSNEEMRTLPYTGTVIGSGRFTETYNLSRAQIREMVFYGGGFVFIAGIILIVGGILEAAILAFSYNADHPRVASEYTESAPIAGAAVQPTYDHAAAAIEGQRNKEIVAWVFGGGCVVLGIIALVAQSV